MLPTEMEQTKGKARVKAHMRKCAQGEGKERVKRGKNERGRRKGRDPILCASDLHPKTYFT